MARRAVSAEQKQQRREEILAAALSLFAEQEYEAIAMTAVARRAGVAKGTLYLYYPTKEALFLALLQRGLSGWLDRVDADLAGAALDAARLQEVITAPLIDRPELLRLTALLHTVLERNIDADTALAFKRGLAVRIAHSGRLLEQALPGLAPGEGPRLLLRIHALIIGLHQQAHPAPVIAEILRREDMAVLRVDFPREFRAALAALLSGLSAAKE